MGVIGIKILAEKGPVVGTLMVEDDDEILAVTRNGVLIRTRVEDISMQGRSASGVKIMTPDGDDVVASIALVNPDPEAVEIEIVDGDDIDPESEGTN